MELSGVRITQAAAAAVGVVGLGNPGVVQAGGTQSAHPEIGRILNDARQHIRFDTD